MLELSGFVAWLLSPLSMAWLLGLGAWMSWRRRPRLGKGLAIAGISVLWIGSMPVAGNLLGAPLETRYGSVAVADAPQGDVIVLLGGAVLGARPPRRPNLALGGSADRIWQAAALYRAGKAPWLVVAAGERTPAQGREAEAYAIVRMLSVLGVPQQRILIDDQSRNTGENAIHALPLVERIQARRVLLVTSALHMPRAVKTFESAWAGKGLAITPIPSDLSGDAADNFTMSSLVPSVDTLRFVTQALKEYAGLVALDIM
ncbi:MAG: YdcF family protein [Pseudomonadota bacterium]